MPTLDAEEFPEEEGKDADGKKDKKRLPALNLKKRKNSVDKKKLRMFSPRKLFDKDRSKASPDSNHSPPRTPHTPVFP